MEHVVPSTQSCKVDAIWVQLSDVADERPDGEQVGVVGPQNPGQRANDRRHEGQIPGRSGADSRLGQEVGRRGVDLDRIARNLENTLTS